MKLRLVEDDYGLNHPDINAAKDLEEFYDLFNIFKVHNIQIITLTLAAARTIASHLGYFKLNELDGLLEYIGKTNRAKIIRMLRDNGWIVENGMDYEMPGYVRSLLTHMFSSLVRGHMSIADQIELMPHEAAMIEHYNLDEDDSERLYKMTFNRLMHWKDYMERVLQKRSRKEIAQIVYESPAMLKALNTLEKSLKKRKNNLFSTSETQRFHDLSSDIQILITQILTLGIENIRENTKAIGEYIGPEMVEDYLHNTSVETLSGLSIKHFSAPKKALQVRDENLVLKAVAFITNQKDNIVVTLPPEPVEFQTIEMVVQEMQNPLEAFYQDVLLGMVDKEAAPIEEVVYKKNDTFGVAIYRTGQMIKLAKELHEPDTKNLEKKLAFSIDIIDSLKEIPEGPVALQNDTYVRKEVENGSNQ